MEKANYEKKVTRKICVPFLSREHNPYSEYVFFFLKNFYKELHTNFSVCDVGCGRMRHLELFESLGFYNLYGCDKFKFKEKTEIQFLNCDLEVDKPFDGEKFDIVLCNFILMFIKPERRAFFLDHIKGLVRPGGYLVFEIYSTARTRNTYDSSIEEVLSHYNGSIEYLNVRKYGFIGRIL